MIPLLFIVMDIWSTLAENFGRFGDEVLGSPMLIGIIIFLFIFFFMAVLFIPFEAMAVIFVPTCFAIAVWIPAMQLAAAIIISIIIGLGLLKWIRG